MASTYGRLPLKKSTTSTSNLMAQMHGSNTRSAPYKRTPQQATATPDPQHTKALEQLLRTVAERTAHMSTQDIIKLTASFAASFDAAGVPTISLPRMERNQPPVGSGSPWYASGPVGGRLNDVGGSSWSSQGYSAKPSSEYDGNYPSTSSSLPPLIDVVGLYNTVKVSSKTNVKSIAGSVSKALRASETIMATAVGPEGSNHAMKALCIARCYLAADGVDLTACIIEALSDEGMSGGKCFAFKIDRLFVPAVQAGPLCASGVGRAEPLSRQARPLNLQVEMKVSGSGLAGPLAGAISKCLREEKEAVITAIGPASVAKCVEALALARSYLQPEHLELRMFPGFETVVLQEGSPCAGESRSSIKIHAWAEPLIV